MLVSISPQEPCSTLLAPTKLFSKPLQSF